MIEDAIYHGGLIVDGPDAGLMDRCARIVAATLEDFGHPVERNGIHNDAAARVVASHYAVQLSLSPLPDKTAAVFARSAIYSRVSGQRWRVEMSMVPADPARDDSDISELLLVVMLYRMTCQFETEAIEWLDPLTVLTADQFGEAFAKITPGAVRSRGGLSDIDAKKFQPVEDMALYLDLRWDAMQPPPAAEAEDNVIPLPKGSRPFLRAGSGTGPASVISLAAAKLASVRPQAAEETDEETPSDVQRLAIWGMTGMMAFLSTPVAASMAAVNLIRGEDLRLNTHVLSLTGLLFTLQSTGMLATAVNALPL